MADKFLVWCKDCYETMRENLNNEYGKGKLLLANVYDWTDRKLEEFEE